MSLPPSHDDCYQYSNRCYYETSYFALGKPVFVLVGRGICSIGRIRYGEGRGRGCCCNRRRCQRSLCNGGIEIIAKRLANAPSSCCRGRCNYCSLAARGSCQEGKYLASVPQTCRATAKPLRVSSRSLSPFGLKILTS